MTPQTFDRSREDIGNIVFLEHCNVRVPEQVTATAFYVQVPDAKGKCPSNTLPVYRFFDNRRDANHRYSVDLSVRRAMNNRAWVPEGSGSGVAFCSPI